MKKTKKTCASVTMPNGGCYYVKSLLSDKNVKLEKTNYSSEEYMVTGLSLAPAHTSGYEVCQGASAGCREACLFTAGQGRFENVTK